MKCLHDRGTSGYECGGLEEGKPAGHGAEDGQGIELKRGAVFVCMLLEERLHCRHARYTARSRGHVRWPW